MAKKKPSKKKKPVKRPSGRKPSPRPPKSKKPKPTYLADADAGGDGTGGEPPDESLA